MPVRGLFISRAGLAGAILGLFVFLPKVLVKAEMESWFTDWFANPYASFIIIIAIAISVFNYHFWGHKLLFLVSLVPVALVAYLYVWALYL